MGDGSYFFLSYFFLVFNVNSRHVTRETHTYIYIEPQYVSVQQRRLQNVNCSLGYSHKNNKNKNNFKNRRWIRIGDVIGRRLGLLCCRFWALTRSQLFITIFFLSENTIKLLTLASRARQILLFIFELCFYTLRKQDHDLNMKDNSWPISSRYIVGEPRIFEKRNDIFLYIYIVFWEKILDISTL